MRKKGFTLTELIIVIAIIGVLTGVLIPSWGYYMSSSKTRAQNLKAKAIFNAAQSFATDMKFAERKYINILTDSSASNDKKKEAETYVMGTWNGSSTEWCIYFNGDTPGYCESVKPDPDNPSGTIAGSFRPTAALFSNFFSTPSPEQENIKQKLCNDSARKLHDSIGKIVDESGIVYKVYVKDYKVVSVASARFEQDSYIGTYPSTLDNLEDKGVKVSEIRKKKVMLADMTQFAL